jgi:uroporphyrinogen decarboxylase
MLPRERQLAAIRHEIPDRIPVDAICVENTGPLAAHLGIAEEDVPDRLGLDGRIVAAGPCADAVPGSGRGLDEWGTDAFDDYGTGHVFPLGAAESVAEVERYPWPDPARCDFADAAARARRLSAVHAVRGPYWVPLFCRACSLMGMEEALAAMMLRPAVFEAVLERVTVHVEEYCSRFLAAAGDGVDILCLGDDFATQRGLAMRPALWRRFLKPRLARIFAVGRRAGRPVWFHSCGDITAVLPDLIDIGMDVWETVQVHLPGNNPVELKREYGREIAFYGGINSQLTLPYGTPEQVRAEVRDRVRVLGKGGGYICSSDHSILPGVPFENVLAMIDEAKKTTA